MIALRPFEDAVGVEGQFAAEEVVERVAVEQGAGRHEDQSLVPVRDDRYSRRGVDRLLVVFRSWCVRVGSGAAVVGAATAVANEVRTKNRCPKRRHRRGDDPLGKALVVDERDVEDPQPRLAAGGIEILAARLDRQDLRAAQPLADVAAGMLVSMLELAVPFDMLLKLVGIGQLVQRAADDRLRLVALGHHDGRQPVIARADPAVAADEVDEVRPLHQELRHDRVVVVALGEMTVGAHLGVGVPGLIGVGL